MDHAVQNYGLVKPAMKNEKWRRGILSDGLAAKTGRSARRGRRTHVSADEYMAIIGAFDGIRLQNVSAHKTPSFHSIVVKIGT